MKNYLVISTICIFTFGAILYADADPALVKKYTEQLNSWLSNIYVENSKDAEALVAAIQAKPDLTDIKIKGGSDATVQDLNTILKSLENSKLLNSLILFEWNLNDQSAHLLAKLLLSNKLADLRIFESAVGVGEDGVVKILADAVGDSSHLETFYFEIQDGPSLVAPMTAALKKNYSLKVFKATNDSRYDENKQIKAIFNIEKEKNKEIQETIKTNPDIMQKWLEKFKDTLLGRIPKDLFPEIIKSLDVKSIIEKK